MSSLKSPEDRAKQWLEEAIAPYGGIVVKGQLKFGQSLIISRDYVTYTVEYRVRTHCLAGKRPQWRGKPLPTYDWLLACFYTVLKDVGCTASRGKRAEKHHGYKCRRCLSHKMILRFLKERRWDKHDNKQRKARNGKENKL